jgi:hypothetical protein
MNPNVAILNLVAADVSPLHLSFSGSQSRLTSAAASLIRPACRFAECAGSRPAQAWILPSSPKKSLFLPVFSHLKAGKQASMAGNHGTADHFDGTADHFDGTADHFDGTGGLFQGAKDDFEGTETEFQAPEDDLQGRRLIFRGRTLKLRLRRVNFTGWKMILTERRLNFRLRQVIFRHRRLNLRHRKVIFMVRQVIFECPRRPAGFRQAWIRQSVRSPGRMPGGTFLSPAMI